MDLGNNVGMGKTLVVVSLDQVENTKSAIDIVEEINRRDFKSIKIFSFSKWKGTRHINGLKVLDCFRLDVKILNWLYGKTKFPYQINFHLRAQKFLAKCIHDIDKIQIISDSWEQERALIGILAFLSNKEECVIDSYRIEGGFPVFEFVRHSMGKKAIHVMPSWINCGSSTTFEIVRNEIMTLHVAPIEILVRPYTNRQVRLLRNSWQQYSKYPNQIMATPTLKARMRIGLNLLFNRKMRDSIIISNLTFYSSMRIPKFWSKKVKKINLSLCYVNHYFNLLLTEGLIGKKSKPLLILDTHDIQSNNYSEQNYVTKFTKRFNGLQQMLREEFTILTSADVIVFVNNQELEMYETSQKNPNQTLIHSIPISSTGTELKNQKTNSTILNINPKSLIVMSDNQANRASIDWFFREILTPNNLIFHVTIVGGIKEYVESRYDTTNIFKNVKCLGIVEDLENIYDEFEIVLVPIILGGGIAIKTLEAIRKNKVIISTKAGMRGIATTDLDWVAQTASDFHQIWSHAFNSIEFREKILEEVRQFRVELHERSYSQTLFPAILQALEG
jgi:hypothetical protein